MENYGVSLSVKQCRNFGVSELDCLKWLLETCGFKRFRLMSYWDEIESVEGKFDFENLDRQFKFIAKHKGSISLCLGVRQPRWPENHWPKWALELPKEEKTHKLLRFIEEIVNRYKKYDCIVSYQLENEALLKSFGLNSEVDRQRLRREFTLVKQLDPTRPVITTTSTSWGIPLRRPIGDIIGFSYYQILYNARKQAYTTAFHKIWLQKLKALILKLIWRRSSFIHELQLEPWGPKNIWEMSRSEQNKSMNLNQIEKNIKLVLETELTPVDLWGGEWWYWCQLHGRDEIIDNVIASIKN